MSVYRFASERTAFAAIHHLRVAARVYEHDAKELAHLPRAAAQFQRQAADANEIADDIKRQVFR